MKGVRRSDYHYDVNYLAHTLLSRQSPETIVGAILGDFAKGDIGSRFTPTMRTAIALHRAIDRYTDSHPLTLASQRLISPARRRFAPVMVDVFYDHFVARYWSDYCDLPLPQFVCEVYGALHRYRDILPERLRDVVVRMTADDWLNAYVDIAGVNAAIDGIARRLRRFRRADVVRGGGEELEWHYSAFEQNFRLFFPALLDFTTCLTLDRDAGIAG